MIEKSSHLLRSLWKSLNRKFLEFRQKMFENLCMAFGQPLKQLFGRKSSENIYMDLKSSNRFPQRK